MILDIPTPMLVLLKEHIEGCDFCYLCDCHPGGDHHCHDSDCPLRAVWHDPAKCGYCEEERKEQTP